MADRDRPSHQPEADITAARRPLGITVLGDFILSEGVEAVLDNVQRAGATAVACNPTVTAAAADGEGSFQPPTDAGSSPRVFDRPLFGRHSLWVESGPSFVPDASLYHDSSYGPRRTNDLTALHGHVIGDFIAAAKDRGLQIHMQVGAAQPTGLRDEDRPRLPDGSLPAGRMADTASLASDAVRAYNAAYVRDVLRAYPQIDALRIDWPESPCYTLGEVFQDFSPHVERWAVAHGFDYAQAQAAALRAWSFLHGELTDAHLQRALDEGVRQSILNVGGLTEWLKIKSALSADIVAAWRNALNDAGGHSVELVAHAFMPTWSIATGAGTLDENGRFAIGIPPGQCSTYGPKLYTMHWSQMIEFWGRELLDANAGLDESLLVAALTELTQLADEDGVAGTALADYGYPAPDEPHPIPDYSQRRKIDQVLRAATGRFRVVPMMHGYGPPDDFARRLAIVAESRADGVWINRYGYLSDEKLQRIAEVWQ